MVDQFQAFLLLGLTAVFVYLAIRVVREDRERAKRARRTTVAPRHPQPPR
jgi:hypothetical protein